MLAAAGPSAVPSPKTEKAEIVDASALRRGLRQG